MDPTAVPGAWKYLRTVSGARFAMMALITKMPPSFAVIYRIPKASPKMRPSLDKEQAKFGSTILIALAIKPMSTIANSTCFIIAVTMKMPELFAQDSYIYLSSCFSQHGTTAKTLQLEQ